MAADLSRQQPTYDDTHEPLSRFSADHFPLASELGEVPRCEDLSGLTSLLTHLSGFATSLVLTSALEIGILDLLQQPTSIEDLCSTLKLDETLLSAVLSFLVRSDHVDISSSGLYALTPVGRSVLPVRGWLQLLVGGYTPVLRDLSALMKGRHESGLRNMEMVAVGSANIGRFDSIPLTIDLIRRSCIRPRKLVDLGCGNAEYLLTYADTISGIRVEGCEPSEQGFAAALRKLKEAGRENDVRLLRASAQEYPLTRDVDIVVLAFVLHEICGISGEASVRDFLISVRQRSPYGTLIIIEVDEELTHTHMTTAIGRGYYNAYHLLHPFTGQTLLSRGKWEEIFASAGYTVVATATTIEEVDPTGLELGYALRPTEIDLEQFGT